jgi:flagellar biosynthesis/type III secretory pathway protein FliH
MHYRTGCAVLLLLVLAGCQSGREQMLEQGYPPAFADGYHDGCVSGRHSIGALGDFVKNVPRYLKEKTYSTGWDDGFNQCQASARTQQDEGYRNRWDDRERDWERQKTQSMGRAFKSN